MSDPESSDEEDLMEVGALMANQYQGNVRKESTKRNYLSKLNAFYNWCRQNAENAVGDEGIFFPLDTEVVKSFLALKSFKDLERTKMQSPGLLKGYISAFKYGYEVNDMTMPPEQDKQLKTICKGYSKRYAQGKEDGKVNQVEGKRPLPESGYRALCKYALKNNFRDSLFTHLYMVLLWNLCQRTVTVGSIKVAHISWGDDALQVFISRHKGDQEGENAYARNVFANPDNPCICPILALAVHIFSQRIFDDDDDGGDDAEKKERMKNVTLFSHSANEKVFGDWLKKSMEKCGSNHSPDLTETILGISPSEMGSHSFRKGVSTSATKHPGGPSTVSLFLRCGWKLGDIQSRYIFEGDGADQYLGRAVALLDITDVKKFTVLPPHVHRNDLERVVTESMWRDMIPGYQYLPPAFHKVCNYLIASLAFHKDNMRNLVHELHPLFVSRVWTSGVLSELKPLVHSTFRKCTGCDLVASGIPVQWSQAKLLTSIEEKVVSLANDTSQQLSTIMDKVDNMPAKLQEFINENYDTQAPATAAQMTQVIQDAMSNLRRDLMERTLGLREQMDVADETAPVQYFSQTWGGKLFVPLPPDYKFGSSTCLTMFQLWFLGDRSTIVPIRPFRVIAPRFFAMIKAKSQFIKGSVVVRKLLQLGIAKGLIRDETEAATLSPNALQSLFFGCYHELVSQLKLASSDTSSWVHSPFRRTLELKFTTIYNDIAVLGRSSNRNS